MLSSISLKAPVTARPACASPAQRLRAPKRASLQIVNIGNINDPEKTKDAKEKKKNDSSWAEPRNKNPLEKKSIMRGEPGKAAETEGNPIEGVVEKAKQAVDDAKDAVSGGDK